MQTTRLIVGNRTTSTRRKTRTNHKQRFQWVLMELDLAIAFFAMARPDENNPNLGRNIENAEKTYGDGVRLLFNANLSRESRRDIIERLALLHTKIRDFDQQMIFASGLMRAMRRMVCRAA